jgi:membrane-associated phospholipid phosphatase
MRAAIRSHLRALTARTALLFAATGVGAIGFAALARAVVQDHTDAWDTRVSLAVHAHASPALDEVMRTISALGAAPHIIFVIALVGIWALYNRFERAAFVAVANYLVVDTANLILKVAFARERPVLFWGAELHLDYSFPSGHAMVSTAVYGVLAAIAVVLCPRGRVWIVAGATLLVLAIGLSRVYLGAHWPTDVIAGFGAGVPFIVVGAHVIGRPRKSSDGTAVARR